MAKLHDLTGKTFGNWLVLYRNGSTSNKASVWHCRCLLCGNEKDVVGASLYNGASTKCRACVPKQTLSMPHRNERIYRIYTGMKQRCTNPNALSYHDYGGRGISVCDEWLNNPDSFIEWALSNGYQEHLTIDRIDNNGNYDPANCRWISYSEQCRNKRNNRTVVCNGVEMVFSDACVAIGISRNAVDSYRRRHKVSYQTAFDHYATP